MPPHTNQSRHIVLHAISIAIITAVGGHRTIQATREQAVHQPIQTLCLGLFGCSAPPPWYYFVLIALLAAIISLPFILPDPDNDTRAPPPDDRGRITVPDVLFLLMSFAFLAALYPVFYDALQQRVGSLTPGTTYLLQLILPLALLVLLSLMYRKAVQGVA